MAIVFDIFISEAAAGARSRVLQGARDTLGLAGALAGGPLPAPLSPLQLAVLQAIIALSTGLQLPAPDAAGATPASPFGGQMGSWLLLLGSPAVSAAPVQLLVDGVGYGSVDAAGVAALRSALAAQQTTAPRASAGEGAPVAAIAGGVVGAALVVAAALAVLLLRRRRRHVGADAAAAPSPHVVISPLASADAAKARAFARAIDGDDGSGVNPLHQASRAGSNNVAGSRSGGSSDAHATLRKAALAAFSQRVILKDAGGSDGQSYAAAASVFAASETPHVNPLRPSSPRDKTNLVAAPVPLASGGSGDAVPPAVETLDDDYL